MEDKQVKQQDYVTNSQSVQVLHYFNTSRMFNSVCTTVHYTLLVCYHAQSKGEKGNMKRREGSWHVTNYPTKPCMSAYEWNCRTMCTCTILIVNLLAE